MSRCSPVHHPDDVAERARLLILLRRIRLAAGITQHQLGAALGIDPLNALRRERPGRDPFIASLQVHASVLEHRVVYELVDLPNVDDDPDVRALRLLADHATTPEAGDAYDRAVLLAQLTAVRRARGWTHRSTAEVLGCSHSAVSRIESSQNPLLSSPQRYARVLGGRLTVDLEPITQHQETAA